MSLITAGLIAVHLLAAAGWAADSATGCQSRNRFQSVSGARDCLAERFVRLDRAAPPGDVVACAASCIGVANGTCRAFATDAAAGCRLFVFDACSRGLVGNNCSSRVATTRIFVRWPGLCPEGARFAAAGAVDNVTTGQLWAFAGSLYWRTAIVGTWAAARASCDAAVPGLSKLADLDGGAVEMRAAAAAVGATATTTTDELWVSATRPAVSDATIDSWRWADCGGAVDAALFGAVLLNTPAQTVARLKEAGQRIADSLDSASHAGLCECLDPFYAGSVRLD